MIIPSTKACPPGALPIERGPIPVNLHPDSYVMRARALGYQVIAFGRQFYLVPLH